MTQEDTTEPRETAGASLSLVTRLGKTLGAYKELIAIVVFFFGGFAYLDANYPSKTEFQTTNCLLKTYMLITQLQLRNYQLEKSISRLRPSVKDYDDLKNQQPAVWAQLTKGMKADVEVMRAELLDSEKELQKVLERIREEKDGLQMHKCGESS
jgi:hypothetical protein